MVMQILDRILVTPAIGCAQECVAEVVINVRIIVISLLNHTQEEKIMLCLGSTAYLSVYRLWHQIQDISMDILKGSITFSKTLCPLKFTCNTIFRL